MLTGFAFRLVKETSQKQEPPTTQVPPGAGLNRTQSRNQRRAIARKLKREQYHDQVLKQQENDLHMKRRKIEFEPSDNSSSSSDESSSESESESESSESSDSSDSSEESSSEDSDSSAAPSETNYSSSKPEHDDMPVHKDPVTKLPYRTYKNIRLESIECAIPGQNKLQVPRFPFSVNDVPRVPEQDPVYKAPFNTAAYKASLTQVTDLSTLKPGNVILLPSVLISKPPTYLPHAIQDVCALVVAEYDPDLQELEVQLASQFVDPDPVLDQYTSAPPRIDYGYKTLTSSDLEQVFVYANAPTLAQYKSAYFSAELGPRHRINREGSSSSS